MGGPLPGCGAGTNVVPIPPTAPTHQKKGKHVRTRDLTLLGLHGSGCGPGGSRVQVPSLTPRSSRRSHRPKPCWTAGEAPTSPREAPVAPRLRHVVMRSSSSARRSYGLDAERFRRGAVGAEIGPPLLLVSPRESTSRSVWESDAR